MPKQGRTSHHFAVRIAEAILASGFMSHFYCAEPSAINLNIARKR